MWLTDVMTLIEDYATCGGCGAELVIYTDGRTATVKTVDTDGFYYRPGATDEVWRDGVLLACACPALDSEYYSCGWVVRFIGKGRVHTENTYYTNMEPIKEDMP